jgi:methionyl-tRNA formyltransferase
LGLGENMKCMILAGDDKLGRRLLNTINDPDVLKVTDTSFSLNRIFTLIKNRRISPFLLLKMSQAELMRKDSPAVETPTIKSNNDLLEIINKNEIDAVFMFRVGLYINKDVITSRAKIINFHCARLPEYGGLGVIDRAIKDGALDQEATMYYISKKIDNGETIATRPYQLRSTVSYLENEDTAFSAGIHLMQDQLAIWKTK